jgi:hypothetical protein
MKFAYSTYSATYDCSSVSSGLQPTLNYREPTPKPYLAQSNFWSRKDLFPILWYEVSFSSFIDGNLKAGFMVLRLLGRLAP